MISLNEMNLKYFLEIHTILTNEGPLTYTELYRKTSIPSAKTFAKYLKLAQDLHSVIKTQDRKYTVESEVKQTLAFCTNPDSDIRIPFLFAESNKPTKEEKAKYFARQIAYAFRELNLIIFQKAAKDITQVDNKIEDSKINIIYTGILIYFHLVVKNDFYEEFLKEFYDNEMPPICLTFNRESLIKFLDANPQFQKIKYPSVTSSQQDTKET